MAGSASPPLCARASYRLAVPPPACPGLPQGDRAPPLAVAALWAGPPAAWGGGGGGSRCRGERGMAGRGAAAPPLLSAAAAGSLAVCALQLGLAWALGRRLGGRCPPADRWVLGWLCYDVLVHCTLVSAARAGGSPRWARLGEWRGPQWGGGSRGCGRGRGAVLGHGAGQKRGRRGEEWGGRGFPSSAQHKRV